jgi:hypothetical protein
MATTMTKAKIPTEGVLVPVDQDPDVLTAAELARTLEERDEALRREGRAIERAANPNDFGSADHRIPLTEVERIAAHDRLQAIAVELRQLRVDRPAAEERLRAARARAYDRAEPAAREQLLPLLARVWDHLEQAAEAQTALEREAERLNRALGRPRFQFPGWPDLRVAVDDRRRHSP